MSEIIRVPYVPSSWDRVAIMIEVAEVKPGMKTLDLGSGDGRVVLAMAQEGAIAYGYETNPYLVDEARRRISDAGMNNQAFILHKDYWNENLSDFDIITIYGIASIMELLEKKLKNELCPGAKVISNFFTFPGWTPSFIKDKIYLYEKREGLVIPKGLI